MKGYPTSGSMAATDIYINVHYEDGTVWAESGQWPGWSAAADTMPELMVLIQESVDLFRPGAPWTAVGDFGPSEKPTP